jgi:hypothetical protein
VRARSRNWPNRTGARRRCVSIEALAALRRFDTPISTWRVHGTAWISTGEPSSSNERAATHHAKRPRPCDGSSPNPFLPGEPLHDVLLQRPSGPSHLRGGSRAGSLAPDQGRGGFRTSRAIPVDGPRSRSQVGKGHRQSKRHGMRTGRFTLRDVTIQLRS